MELNDCRARLDRIDGEILALFVERMEYVAEIAAWKREHGMPVLDREREREKLDALKAQTPEALKEYSAALFSEIMELSRAYQDRLLQPDAQGTDVKLSR
ncbi:MAG: chorismate mutase [Oscillospiraceae bacterium]|nr:chorismate mutase [Oscillospiraceae bacterium]